MRTRTIAGLALVAAVILGGQPALGHESARVNAQQRVFAKHQNLDRSDARVQLQITNRRFTPIRRLVCTTVISDQWHHPVTGEVRKYSEDWFLVIRRFPARTRLRSQKDTIFVNHPELTADPLWQPQGVTVKTPHCHARG
ncbi:MAG TPA: hypothetical protein VHH92_02640 [Actinomycetota bacterium]|nr:hypothetical protein [Actinomycetota bacterium]